MSNQFFEERPSVMGLFTFYKKQQEDDEMNRGQTKRTKKMKGKSKKKINGFPSSPDAKQQISVDKSDHSDSCDEFLKSIRPKIKRMQLPEVSEVTVNEHQEEKAVMVKEESPRLTVTKKESSHSQQKPFKLFKQRLSSSRQILLPPTPNKLSASLIPSRENSKNDSEKERQSLNSAAISKKSGNRQLIKQRIRTQVNNQLHKNHFDYIHSAERELIIGKKLAPPQFAKKKSEIRQKIAVQERKKGVSVSGASILSKSAKLLHEQNKRYLNNLIENLSVQPQYNQTVYRILRQTLKFPQLARSSYRHIKTETTSPTRRKHELQIRSQSYCKKAILQEGVKERQKNWKGGLMSVVAKGGSK